jgi:hypothetical protein
MNIDTNNQSFEETKQVLHGENLKPNEPIEESTKEQLHLNGLKDFYKMRNRWSKHILIIIYGVIIVYGLLLIGVGTSYLDYSKYPYFLSISSGEVFICILGLAYIVVKFLFKTK